MAKINKEPSGASKAESILIATTDGDTVYKSSTKISDLAAGHTQLHAMTSATDHSATTWRIFYSNASGDVTELALGTSGQVLASNGATSAPSFQDVLSAGDIGTTVQGWAAVLDATTASFLIADETKLGAIEALADVTDATNVANAGALMDSEVDANIKTLVLPASTTISTFGRTLVDDLSNTAARSTLNVDVAGTDNSTAVTITGEDYLSLSTQQITANAIDLDNLSATGTADNTKYLRGDNLWSTIPVVGSWPSSVTDHIRAGNIQLWSPGSGTASIFNVVSNITENTFETVGPTGSGATNIWTAMDVLPTEATAVIVAVTISVTTSGTSIGTASFYATQGDSTDPITTADNRKAYIEADFDAANKGTQYDVEVMIPLGPTNQDFRATWFATQDTARSCSLLYRGFITD